jgi:mono/diheme cytochrome c family protein
VTPCFRESLWGRLSTCAAVGNRRRADCQSARSLTSCPTLAFRRCAAIALLAAACLFAATTDDTKLTPAEARKLHSPIPYTKKSIDRGRIVYSQNCTSCHGTDGKAELAVIAEATDLTSPKLYKNGTTEGEIFRSIRDGAGDQMPPFKSQIEKEDDIWHLVNFVRSLWPEAARPRLEDKGN